MSDRIYRFIQGGVEGAAIEVLEPEAWDLNRMLPEQQRLPSDSEVVYSFACAYLGYRGRHVMVDGGYHAQEVADALAELDLAPGDIDLVLITHGDGDHVLGLLTEQGELAYPNAQYVVHQELWDHWHSPGPLSGAPESRQGLLRALALAMEQRVALFHDECEVHPSIRAVPTPGHRIGHCTYEFATDGAPIHHFGDTLFHPLFAEHPDWLDTMALDPLLEAESRRRMLARAASSAALVLACHIPFPGTGRIERDGDAFRWIPEAGTP